MKRTGLVVILATLVFVVATVPANATQEHARGGFFVGFGLGGGTATLDSDVDNETGGGGMFRIGYAPQDNLTVGLESAAWVKEFDDGDATVTWTFSVSTAGVTFYPGNNGLYVKGGVGFATVEAEISGTTPLGDLTLTASDNGLGLLGAFGYEARLTKKFALGGEAMFAPMFISDLSGTYFFNIAVTLNWYWSKNA